MPHTFSFAPPLRGSRGGPLLRMELPSPTLEQELSSKRMDATGFTPYRAGLEVENLLDRLTMGISPRTLDEGVLFLAVGLSKEKPGRDPGFMFSPEHVHRTEAPMTPDVLLGHSAEERKDRLVSIAALEELSLLAVSLMRSMGYGSYHSTIKTPDGSHIPGLAILKDGELCTFIIRGVHPKVSELVIFEDPEVLHLLSLLRAHKGLKKLAREMSIGLVSPEQAGAILQVLSAEYASGLSPNHPLSRLLEKELLSLGSALASPDRKPC